MKYAAFFSILIAAAPAWSLTYLGPPLCELEKEKIETGISYSTGETNVKISGHGIRATLDDVEADSIFVTLAAGFGHNIEIYGKLGMAEVEDFGQEFALGVGLKSTLIDSPDLAWGMIIQIVSFRGEESAALDGFKIAEDLEAYEVQVAAGPTWKSGCVSIYGGPYAHRISGDVTLSLANQNLSFDIEQKSVFGGYAGLSIEIKNSIDISLEGQWTGDSSGYAVSACLKF